MSARYATVVAMLDDAANFACVMRELQRRGHPKLALPSQRTAGGTMCFMSFRWHLRTTEDPSKADRADILAEVWAEPSGDPTPARWWVTLQDGAELGPFDGEQIAASNAVTFLQDGGWTVMGAMPWDDDDFDAWPVGQR